MAGREVDETRITGRLPNLDIEIIHARTENAERVTVSLVAVPSFDAFARLVEAGNPLLAWTRANPFATAWLQMVQAAWAPLLGPAGLLPGKRDAD